MVLSYLGDYDNDDCFIFHFIFGATFYWVSDGIKDETLPSLTFLSVCMSVSASVNRRLLRKALF